MWAVLRHVVRVVSWLDFMKSLIFRRYLVEVRKIETHWQQICLDNQCDGILVIDDDVLGKNSYLAEGLRAARI